MFATGFDAMTGALLAIDIRGRGGRDAAREVGRGPAHLPRASAPPASRTSSSSPGPGSPSVLSNMVPSIEQHVDWIADCIALPARARPARASRRRPTAEDAWVAHVNEVADLTLYPTCNSWYLGANVPGKPRVFMPYLGFPPYVEK